MCDMFLFIHSALCGRKFSCGSDFTTVRGKWEQLGGKTAQRKHRWGSLTSQWLSPASVLSPTPKPTSSCPRLTSWSPRYLRPGAGACATIEATLRPPAPIQLSGLGDVGRPTGSAGQDWRHFDVFSSPVRGRAGKPSLRQGQRLDPDTHTTQEKVLKVGSLR